VGIPQIPTLTGLERIFTFELPMRMKVNNRGDMESLNLNVFRNQHHYKTNHQKVQFHKLFKKQLEATPKLGKIWLHYEVHPKTRVRLDTMNPGSIVDKFFSDALVEHGVIEDDNYHYVVFNSFSFGFVDKINPHVLVTIIEIEQPESEKDMRILLDNMDIQNALDSYVLNELGLSGATGVRIEATADGSITAEVMMGEVVEVPTTNATTPKPKAKRRTKAQMQADDAKAQEEAEPDVEQTVPDSGDLDAAGSADAGEEETLPAEEASEPEIEDADVVEDQPTPANDGKSEPVKKSKNLFADKSAGSSKDTDTKPESAKTETETPDPETVTTPAKKKSSIFDQ
jgi:hypothetical protein